MKKFGFILMLLTILTLSAQAQDSTETDTSRVGEFFGYLHPTDHHFYDIPNLKAGDTVYLLLENVSGNLDPYLRFGNDAHDEFMAEDDDSGNGSDAILVVEIPEDGTYTATAATCCQNTFGEYRLVIGINAPEVLSEVKGYAEEPIAFLNVEESEFSLGVEDYRGTIDTAGQVFEHDLTHLMAGHTLYIYAEPMTENFDIEVELKDFQGKVLADSIEDERGFITIQYPVVETGDHYDLVVKASDGQSTGTYRILIGVDDPLILTDEALPEGDPIIREPMNIQIGFELLQITDVDQQNKNFSIVGVLRADWTDHRQAFDPADCQCDVHVFAGESQIFNLLSETDFDWPDFRITNQQAPRDVHNEVVKIHSNGFIEYEERFSVVLQAPEFDFRRFPFDDQYFWLRIETHEPDSFATLTLHPDESYNGVNSLLGEEEWVVSSHNAYITDDDHYYRYNFDLEVDRHASYYLYRILLPLALIVLVGWAIFLIHDYDTQIAAASGNLLIFIAFNFTIGDELPRLGYLTFLDSLLLVGFVVSVLVFAVTVYLKRLHSTGQEKLAETGDKMMLFIYPLVYLVCVIWAYLSFFVFL